MTSAALSRVEERRINERNSIFAEVDIQELASGEIYKTKSINISTGGLVVYSDTRMDLGEIVRIKVNFLFHKEGSAVESIKCEVKWVVDVGSSYAIGLQFDKPINEQSYPHMAHCLNSAVFMEDVFYI